MEQRKVVEAVRIWGVRKSVLEPEGWTDLDSFRINLLFGNISDRSPSLPFLSLIHLPSISECLLSVKHLLNMEELGASRCTFCLLWGGCHGRGLVLFLMAWLLPSRACLGLAVTSLHLPLARSERRHFCRGRWNRPQVPEGVHIIVGTRKLET